MDMIETMRRSEAVEIGLRNGHVVYGRFLGVSGRNFVLCDPDGAVVFVPSTDENLAYAKVVSADPEISRMLDRMYGNRPSRQPVDPQDDWREDPDPPRQQRAETWDPPRRVDQPLEPGRVDSQPVILSSIPSGRQTAIEEVKERHRHSNTFVSSQNAPRAAYRPRIQREDEE
jgi:hypothetical protein